MGCVFLIVVLVESKASWATIVDESSAKDSGELVVVGDISRVRIGVAWFCDC
jgi:hypothetical protein